MHVNRRAEERRHELARVPRELRRKGEGERHDTVVPKMDGDPLSHVRLSQRGWREALFRPCEDLHHVLARPEGVLLEVGA